MNDKRDYPYKDNNYMWIGFGILIAIILGVSALIMWLIPNFFAFINWFVPNFWSLFGYIIIIWIGYKFFSFIWTPIYSILGKWSLLILIATVIYIIMQIN